MKKQSCRRFAAALLTLVLLLSLSPSVAFAADAWDGSTVTPVTETAQDGSTGSGYYLISSASELAWVAQQVNSGMKFSGKTILLVSDIDLGKQPWTPIGTNTVNASGTGSITGGNAFAGVFDGDKHTISNLFITSPVGGVALFGYSTGELKDFTVSGTVEGFYFTAGVLACGSGRITGVTSQVQVTAEGNCVGGILADATGAIIIDACHNQGKISNNGSSSEKSTGRLGGIAGRIDAGITAVVQNCSNTGSITGYQYIGGIIGGCFGSAEIFACYNSAELKGVSFGKVYLGGIVGKLGGGTVDSCYNSGLLHDSHWASGHVRAIGGIAGCEQDHTIGTAISHCYNIGVIEIDTETLVYGSNWIYMTGNISGGNSSTGANEMHYTSCYYLEGRIAIADPDNSAYKYWADIYKANPLIWDTAEITECTEAELKGAEVLSGLGSAFAADTDSINGSYPILYWQVHQAPPPASIYSVDYNVTGGTATVTPSTSSAEAGTEVTFTVTEIQNGMQIRSVKVTDAAGIDVTVTESAGSYCFTMPARDVSVSVLLENAVAPEAASYALSLPAGLDAIWSVSAESTYLEAGRVKAGATVYVTVVKDSDAYTSSLKGIAVTDADENNIPVLVLRETADPRSSGIFGTYSFTMPNAAVAVALEAEYAALEVYTQTGVNSTPNLVKSYSRADVVSLGGDMPRYYSGWSSETEPFIAKAEQSITLPVLLADAGVSFAAGDTLKTISADGMSLSFPYDKLYGETRSYYPNIISGTDTEAKAANAVAIDPMLVLKGYLAPASDGDVETKICDTLNAYRFVYGQTTGELSGCIKIVDQMPKCITQLIVIKSTSSSGSSGDPGISSSTTWDGKSVAASFAGGRGTASAPYQIATAAQLAYLAELVNNGAPGESMLTGQHFLLTADIDLNGHSWPSIGGGEAQTGFNGVFDGDGHVVSNLYINMEDHYTEYSGRNRGLFGIIDGEGQVRNLGVTGYVHAQRSVGGIAGKNSGLIEGCFNAAEISATDSKGVGGIVGANWNQSIIRNCYNVGRVTGTYTSGSAGGIAGENEYLVENCYNAGRIICGYNAGGIVGSDKHSGGGTSAPGVVGVGIQTNCYYLAGTATAGIGYEAANNSNTVTEVTAAQLKVLAENLGSAFAPDTGGVNGGYPILIWQSGTSTSGPSGVITPVENLEVEIKTNSDGTISVIFPKASEGTLARVTVPITGIASQGDVVVLVHADGTEEAVKKSLVLSGAAIVLLDGSATLKIANRSMDFDDVVGDSWYAEPVDFVSARALFQGTAERLFSPDEAMTRAMLVTVLHRLEDEAAVDGETAFTDVAADSYYADAVAWASQTQIVNGVSADSFAPDDAITREQLVTMFWRYARYLGLDVSKGTDLKCFSDTDSVSDYASAPMAWAVQNGILNGTSDTTLSPRENATRSQVAAMLQRFITLLLG